MGADCGISLARRRAEGFSDRDIIRCLKRHVANEVFRTLTTPIQATPAGDLLRQRRQRLGVPYQRLRPLEIGTRGDDERDKQAHEALDQTNPPQAA